MGVSGELRYFGPLSSSESRRAPKPTVAPATSRMGLDLRIRPESTDLAQVVRAAVESAQPRAAAREVSVDTSGVDPTTAVVDSHRIRQVVDNLLGNAIKFSADGATVRVAVRAEGADWVRFEVADRGVGIPEAEQRHLFEPFFTGFDTHRHCSGTHEFGRRGIGLGLPIARRFIELHGGRIDVESRPGEGATFRFWLPVHEPAGSPAVVYGAASPGGPGSPRWFWM